MPPSRLALSWLLALTLAACASPPAPARSWAETAARELQLSVTSFVLLGRRVTVTRSLAGAGPLPVIVYLPGVGQDSDAGQGAIDDDAGGDRHGRGR